MSTFIEKIKIKIEGIPSEDYNFRNIVWTQELMRPNVLRFSMNDQDTAVSEEEVKFDLVKELFGKKVTLTLQTTRMNESSVYVNEELDFEGIIFNVDVSRADMASVVDIDVTAFSPDYLLMDNKHCFSYEEKSLEELVKETIKPYDFKTKIDPAFTKTIPYSVQYNENNYQYLVRLAKRYGEWLYYDGNKFVFANYDKVIEKLDPIKLFPHTDLVNYNYSAQITHDQIIHNYYDYLKYDSIQKTPEDAGIDVSGNGFLEFTQELKDKSHELYKKDTFHNIHCAIPEGNEAEEYETTLHAQFWGEQAQMSVCRGTSLRADMCIGRRFTIKDIYDKNNTTTAFYDHSELIVCAITHRMEVYGQYENEFTAISAKSKFPPYYNSDIYPVAMMQRAFVTDNQDPEKLGRVRVTFPWQYKQDESLMTPWIRIAQPHGGNNKGFYFIPEIEEEVMVGFENGNAEKPYVVGTFYNAEQIPGSNWYTDSNDIKAIRTRNGHTIEIHDEGDDGFIKIYDNEKENYILTFSTDDKLIKLESTGNIELYAKGDIIMDAGGNINMHSGKDTTIKVDGNQEITVKGDVTEDVTGSFKHDSKEITLKSKSGVTIKATSTMKIDSATHEQKASAKMTLDGGGMLEAKAGMVKIN